MCVHVRIRMCAYVHACMCVYIYMYVCIYVHNPTTKTFFKPRKLLEVATAIGIA